MDNNINPTQLLNLANKNQRQSSGGGGNTKQGQSSGLPKSGGGNAAAASTLPSPFDALGGFGTDLNSAVAALQAASGNFDLAQLNALAQLNQYATNQKLNQFLQLQQQNLLNQLNLPGSPLPPLTNSSLSSYHQSPLAAGSQQQHQASSLNQQSSHGIGGVVGGGGNSMKMNQTRYQQLMGIVDEMGREIHQSYLGNKNSMERLKRAIANARILVKDCQLECERNVKQ
jgi:hypothetical protein